MDVSFFARGLLIGLSIAAVVGPMSILCMQRTLIFGQRYGLVSGLGIATADAVYGSIAAFGVTVIASFLVSQQVWIRLIGGLFLVYLGVKTILTRPAERAAPAQANSFFGAYASTLLLTLTNPLTILSFAAIFAGLGVGTTGRASPATIVLVLGVLVGSALWWVLLSSGVDLVRARVTPRLLRWINRLSGALLVAFGVLAFASLR